MTCPKSEKAACTEALVREALEGIKRKRFKNPYNAAQKLKIAANTVLCQMKGGKSHTECREDWQKLTNTEEKAIAEQVSQLSQTRFPVTHPWL
jgi:hypothetical protein